jgi:hypothetical protein
VGRRPSVEQSTQLEIHLPLRLKTKLSLALWSEVDQRIPQGAYTRLLVELIERHFEEKVLTIDPAARPPLVVRGSPAAISALKELLKCTTP